ncbi:MAG: hypothetical protein ACO4B6_07170, partial [Ilumatobacteraceae bacterium]
MGIKGTLKGITATTMIGAGVLGLGGVAQAATESVDLHNASAQVGSDCPNSTGDWWHFVITPNNGSHEFTSITLNVAGTSRTFSGGAIVGNGSQRDNVFVAVPAGYSADDLRAGGSSAEITDAARRTKFVLSHVCIGEADEPVVE